MSMTALVALEIPSIIFGVFQKPVFKYIIKKKKNTKKLSLRIEPTKAE